MVEFGRIALFEIYGGLSKEAKYLIYQSILPAVAFGMFFTDISYFLTSVQGLSYEFMGIVVTIMGIATFLASIPLGIAADKYGRKKMPSYRQRDSWNYHSTVRLYNRSCDFANRCNI